jgi:hypothetical protein
MFKRFRMIRDRWTTLTRESKSRIIIGLPFLILLMPLVLLFLFIAMAISFALVAFEELESLVKK